MDNISASLTIQLPSGSGSIISQDVNDWITYCPAIKIQLEDALGKGRPTNDNGWARGIGKDHLTTTPHNQGNGHVTMKRWTSRKQ